MDRTDAFLLLRRHLRGRQGLRAALGCEALMEVLAERLGAERGLWGLAGLLSGLDVELTAHNPRARGRVAAEMLGGEGAPAAVVRALGQRLQPGPHDELLVRALAAAEPAAMILLDAAEDRAELAGFEPELLAGLVDDPSLAPTASRTRILALEGDGVALQELMRLARQALLAAADDLY